MKVNFSECKVMHIGKQKYVTSYKMGGEKLAEITSERDLGVVINRKLSA